MTYDELESLNKKFRPIVFQIEPMPAVNGIRISVAVPSWVADLEKPYHVGEYPVTLQTLLPATYSSYHRTYDDAMSVFLDRVREYVTSPINRPRETTYSDIRKATLSP